MSEQPVGGGGSSARRPSRVRFGGMQTPHGYLFELTGGRLCLNLANTLDERPTDHPRELLTDYGDLLDWGVQAGAIVQAEAATMRDYAARHRAVAQKALRRITRLREVLFEIFSAAAQRRAAPPDHLAVLNRVIARALGQRCLERQRGRFVWAWRGATPADLDRLLWPVAWSAAELLTSPDLDRVRQCQGRGCAWLFLDTSKNRTRRWCDMSVCGNRAKARRHHARKRAGSRLKA
jgi:predicted RNA-binding Zn ribbon-like protein